MLTLKKVKEMVKAPVHTKRVPSPKVLLEDGRILLRKEFEHDSHLTLYHSGYVWFSAGKRNTVFHIHDCRGDYAYGASKGKGEVIKEEYFENCEWHIRALFEGEQRVEESQLKCEGVGQTKVCVSYGITGIFCISGHQFIFNAAETNHYIACASDAFCLFWSCHSVILLLFYSCKATPDKP